VIVKGFGGGLQADCFARSGVEREGDGFDILHAVLAQAAASRELLTKQTIRVLDGVALPRAVRVAGRKARDGSGSQSSSLSSHKPRIGGVRPNCDEPVSLDEFLAARVEEPCSV